MPSLILVISRLILCIRRMWWDILSWRDGNAWLKGYVHILFEGGGICSTARQEPKNWMFKHYTWMLVAGIMQCWSLASEASLYQTMSIEICDICRKSSSWKVTHCWLSNCVGAFIFQPCCVQKVCCGSSLVPMQALWSGGGGGLDESLVWHVVMNFDAIWPKITQT